MDESIKMASNEPTMTFLFLLLTAYTMEMAMAVRKRSKDHAGGDKSVQNRYNDKQSRYQADEDKKSFLGIGYFLRGHQL
jgi:hypothetical protein